MENATDMQELFFKEYRETENNPTARKDFLSVISHVVPHNKGLRSAAGLVATISEDDPNMGVCQAARRLKSALRSLTP